MSQSISNAFSTERQPLLDNVARAIENRTQEDAVRISSAAQTVMDSLNSAAQIAQHSHVPPATVGMFQIQTAGLGISAMSDIKVNADRARFELQGMKPEIANKKAEAGRSWCLGMLAGGLFLFMGGVFLYLDVASPVENLVGGIFTAAMTTMFVACGLFGCRYCYNQCRFYSREEPESSYVSWMRP